VSGIAAQDDKFSPFAARVVEGIDGSDCLGNAPTDQALLDHLAAIFGGMDDWARRELEPMQIAAVVPWVEEWDGQTRFAFAKMSNRPVSGPANRRMRLRVRLRGIASSVTVRLRPHRRRARNDIAVALTEGLYVSGFVCAWQSFVKPVS